MYLNCHTAFSFKYGTLTIERLFQEAQRCGITKLALTDINNTAAYVEMLRHCADFAPAFPGSALTRYGKPAHRLDIVLGVEFRNQNDLCFIALAKNSDGFTEINRFLSFHNQSNKAIPARAPEFLNAFVIYPFGKILPELLRDNEYIGIRKSQLTQFSFSSQYKEFPGKFTAWHPVTFANKTDFNVHRLLRAIHNNMLLSKLPAHQQALPDERMMPEDDLAAQFGNYSDLVERARFIMDNCSHSVELGADKNKKHVTGSEQADWDYLRAEAWKGFAERYDADNPVLRERFERELTVIRAKGFCSYYLVAYDLIKFAKRKKFDFVGRGSGANSVIAYCLGITNVDPIELNLYFERFLNAERTTPPDFDIDFSWDNRDDVYNYLFERYGADHVCLLGTHVTYQKRSVIRELGKVFGLPKSEIDALVDNPKKFQSRDHITELIMQYAQHMRDLPANMSIHAGGVLITEKPICHYTAIDVPPKGYAVSHFEMHGAEDLGIFKFDILSQRGLGHIKETVQHIRRNRNELVDVHRFAEFKKDEKIRSLLRNSKTMGCFYVESPAMRMLLGKLRCEDYLTLVAASSIIRPGVARSGMMRAYIERFHAVRNGGSYESVHPKMDDLMAETYGVMVYQEDVIKVAHEFAGLTLTEADVLRRGMSGKFRSREEFKRVEERFFANCHERGYDRAVAERVWFEIESFSGYSFAKGHSASYAVESYQSLFLKAHYPLEFMVGVINNFGGFYRTEFYFHEARMNGGVIEAPCVNNSEYLTTIRGDHIHIGFIHIKSLEADVGKRIHIERARNGPYKSLDNFIRRIGLALEQVRVLIRMGSFRFTGKTKQRLLWETLLYFSSMKARRYANTELFDTEPADQPLPELQRHPLEDAFEEIELLGFPLCDPFLLLATHERGNASAKDLPGKIGKLVEIVGYVVTTKDTSTMKNEPMHFGTFYDQHGDVFDTVHFPNITAQFPFRGRGFYMMRGRVVEDFGVPLVEVSFMDKLPIVNKRAEEFMRDSPSIVPHHAH